MHYGEQQDQGRESTYWTVPGSRTGGAPQEYTNWTNRELTAPASSHFPFILDHHPRQHQDLGEYQPHETRDREWTAAQQAVRDYERGFLREGWQRRWEPCSPVRYNREVSTKRNDNSYRELEAWAARYSHSLPRRRRIEAELRGASQGLLESSRDSRSGRDPRVAALQQVLQSENIRESGLWDRGARQQAPTYYPSQTLASDTSHMLDMKEKTGYQRRMFSQPPGYIAPPPYNSPHKSSPVLHHSDTRWEQEGKRQTYWSQPTVRELDVSADHRKEDKEDLKKPDATQYTFPELEGLKRKRQEIDASQASSPVSIQKPHIPCESNLSLQQPQVLQEVQNKKIIEEPSSKVIEGRKFRLNKKTGGLTIFCLVSRIASTKETPSLPLCTLQTNIQNTELEEVPKGLRDSGDNNQSHKVADEVDFKTPKLTEQLNTLEAKNLDPQLKETPTCIESEMLEDNPSDKAEADVSPEKASTNDDDSTFAGQGTQLLQPVSVKYPLWREPSFTSRAEIESLKANSEEVESGVLHSQEDSAEVHPIDIEVRRLDIKEDSESEDNKGLLVIDTTCVVVKMELIPSPKKEHVHYLDSTEESPGDVQSSVSPECVQSNSQLNQEMIIDQNAETDSLHINEKPETELDSDFTEKMAPDGESEISLPCMSSSSVSEKETLRERAERILGIPLHDCITEQQPADAMSPLDLCVENQEVEPSPIKDKDIDDEAEKIPEDTTEEEQSQNQSEVGQTEDALCLQEIDDTKDQMANEGDQDFAQSQEQAAAVSEENDAGSHLKTDIGASSEIEMAEDPLLKSSCEEGATEQSEDKNQSAEKDTTSQHPSQCLSPPTNVSDSSLSPSLDCEAPNPDLSEMVSSSNETSLMCISESNTVEGCDLELSALNSVENVSTDPETSSLPYTPSQQLPSPPPPEIADFSPNPSPGVDPFPNTSLDLTDQTAEIVSSVEDQDEEGETLQLIINEISDALEDLAKNMTEELVSQEQFESGQPVNAACVKDINSTDEKQTTEANKDGTDKNMEQMLKKSQENATEGNILQQQLEYVQEEDIVCVKESCMSEKQQPEESNEDPVDQIQTLLESKEDAIEDNSLTEEYLPKEVTEELTQEKVTESQTQTEVNILQQQFDNGKQVHCCKETSMTEEQPPKEASHTSLLVETLSKDDAKDSQPSAEIFQDIESKTEPCSSSLTSSATDCEAPQSSLDVFTPCKPLDSISPSAQDPYDAAALAETVHPPLHLDSCNEPLPFSASSDLSPGLPSFPTSLLQEGSGGVSSDLPHKEEPQYPRSLWDAVNRIRKHTAPDSENEEEEVSEPWDPENVGEDLGLPDVEEDMISEKIVFDEAGQQEVSTEGSAEDVAVRQIQQDPCHEELSGHAEEDTLSCSSASSHSSGDTVIIADEDEVKEKSPDASTEAKTENDEEFQTASESTMAKEEKEDGDESIRNDSIHLCPVEQSKQSSGNNRNRAKRK